MNKKAIFTISKAGSQGKSFIASLLLEHLRIRKGVPVGAYLCDLSVGHDILLSRYGQRDEYDTLLENQNPMTGVFSLDLYCQQLLSDDAFRVKQYQEKINNEFISALNNDDADVVLFDIPATHLSDLYAKAFNSLEEFLEIIEMCGRDVYFVMPLGDKKSLESIKNVYSNTKKTNINYVVVVNVGVLKDGNSPESWHADDYYKSMSNTGRYSEMELPDFSKKPEIFTLTERLAFSNFVDNSETDKPVLKASNKNLENGMRLNLALNNLFIGYRHLDGSMSSVFSDIDNIFSKE